MPNPADPQLVEALLLAIQEMSTREAARATGLSHQLIARYRKGWGTRTGWTYLRGDTREKMERYLTRAGKTPRPTPVELTETQRLRALELIEELGRLLRGEA